MREFTFNTLTFSLLIAILLWSSIFGTCFARRARPSRPDTSFSSSLSRNKLESRHGSSRKPYKPPPETPIAPPEGSSSFNVLRFGAKGDGNSDDTKAFQDAWAAACKVEASTMIVPSGYRFLIGPVSFSGPYCMPNLIFQLDGTIIAPTSPKVWGSGSLWWINFTKLKGITVTIDGNGSVWWRTSPFDDQSDGGETRWLVPLDNTVVKGPQTPVKDELGQKMPSIKPTALKFYNSFNVTVTGITIQNSQQCHLKFDNCVGVTVHDVDVTSPRESPNTDGIHLQNTQQVNVHHTNIACGDDCVSIQTGCSNVFIYNVNCGPGHGISIGSLGKDNAKACVSNVTVRDVTISNTRTGVRIKTWQQGGLGSVQGIMFSNIEVSEVELPIMIDQFYCDKRVCKNQTAAVAVSGVTYQGIRGTYTAKPVHFACSDNLPCTDITLTSIQLRPLQERYRICDAFCSQAFGILRTPTEPPIGCLQTGKPRMSSPETQHDFCPISMPFN